MPKVGGTVGGRDSTHLDLGHTADPTAGIRIKVAEFVTKLTNGKPLKAAIFDDRKRVEFGAVGDTTSSQIVDASNQKNTELLKTLLENATATVVRKAVEEILIAHRIRRTVRPFAKYLRPENNNIILKHAGFWLDPPGIPPGQRSSRDLDAVLADLLFLHLADQISSDLLRLDTSKRGLLPRELRLIENGAALARAWGYGPGGAHPEGGFEHRTHKPGILKESQAITDPLFRNLARLTEGTEYKSILPTDGVLLVKKAQKYLDYHKGRGVPLQARQLWEMFLKKDTNTIPRIQAIANYTPPDRSRVSEACLVLVYAARIFLLSAAGQTGRALADAEGAVGQLDAAGGGAAPMEP